MNKRNAFALVATTALVGTMAMANRADAASLTFSKSLTDYTDIQQESLSLDQFKSSLGSLKKVTVSYFTNLTSDASITNNAKSLLQGVASVSGSLNLVGPNSDTLLNQAVSGSSSYSLPSKASTSFNLLNKSYSGTQEYTGSALSSFIGNGLVNFLFSANATSQVTGSGNMSSSIGTIASAKVDLTYDYEPKAVPEPATLTGLGVVAGVSLLTRRKQKASKQAL